MALSRAREASLDLSEAATGPHVALAVNRQRCILVIAVLFLLRLAALFRFVLLSTSARLRCLLPDHVIVRSRSTRPLHISRVIVKVLVVVVGLLDMLLQFLLSPQEGRPRQHVEGEERADWVHVPGAEVVEAGGHGKLHGFELEVVELLVKDEEQHDLDAEEEHAHHDHGQDVVLLGLDGQEMADRLQGDNAEDELVEGVQVLDLPVLPEKVFINHLKV